MKKLIRTLLINFLIFYVLSQSPGAINYSNNLNILLTATLFFTLANLLLKPIINLLLSPINFLTIGSSKWISGTLILFLTDFYVDGFDIKPFTLPSLNLPFLKFPGLSLTLFWSYILVSFIIELFEVTLNWLFS